MDQVTNIKVWNTIQAAFATKQPTLQRPSWKGRPQEAADGENNKKNRKSIFVNGQRDKDGLRRVMIGSSRVPNTYGEVKD